MKHSLIFDLALVFVPEGVSTTSIVCITFRTSPFADYAKEATWLIRDVPVCVTIPACEADDG